MWSMLKGTVRAMKPRGGLRCSFCRRDAVEVDRLVAGASAYICDTCIAGCVAILQDNGGFEPRPDRGH
jgi:ATP-dependent Clp protease ATP-binding subunit ClpX